MSAEIGRGLVWMLAMTGACVWLVVGLVTIAGVTSWSCDRFFEAVHEAGIRKRVRQLKKLEQVQ